MLSGRCHLLNTTFGVRIYKLKFRALRWRKIFAIPIVIIPIIATAAYVGLSFSFGFISPTNDMCCDSASLEWSFLVFPPCFPFLTRIHRVHLFGSSGISFSLSIPIFYLSAQSSLRIRKINHHLLRSLPDDSPCTVPVVGPCRMGSSASRKNTNRATLRDAVMPVNLALMASRKSSIVSMRRSPPLHLPLTLRSMENARTRSASLNLSVTAEGTEIARISNDRGSSRRTKDSDSRLSGRSSHFSLQEGEMDMDERSSDISLSFPTFADEYPVTPSDLRNGAATIIEDVQEGGGEAKERQVFQTQMQKGVFRRVSIVDEVKEDILRPPSSMTDNGVVISMHKIELLTSESGSLVEEARDKIDLRSTVESGGDTQEVGLDLAMMVQSDQDRRHDHLRKHSTGSKTTPPTSMVFSINGEFIKCLRDEFGFHLSA